MTDRRRFLKTLTATAGSLSLPIVTVAQENSKFLPSVIDLVLNEPVLITTAPTGTSTLVTSPFRTSIARLGTTFLTLAPAAAM